ncbi:hypothetical protein [Niveispirillum cyanobacteriorum]|uniref:Uncharacterized protein n=1 Tax=Niveispirillum cyanobacteriorum TaxID=1612173 RepID=A0A2K9NHL6_9PROT|nr:hypothetical protein [Niveispirillum cyanobacteriorum]AUN32582.1 hypothetical protein C0V82_19800 [Niveispirillum cyanobacteriorum]GGE77030.1 hypothetical protein GCM10011317_37610 [Niveispirillum cyanobacteriorum]
MRCLVLDLDGSLTGQTGLRQRIDDESAILVPARGLGARLRILASRRGLTTLRRRIAEAFPLSDGPAPLIFHGSGDCH